MFTAFSYCVVSASNFVSIAFSLHSLYCVTSYSSIVLSAPSCPCHAHVPSLLQPSPILLHTAILHSFTVLIDRALSRPRDCPSHANHLTCCCTLKHEALTRTTHHCQAVEKQAQLLDRVASRPCCQVFSDAPLLGPLNPVNTENLRILFLSIDYPVGFWVWSQLYFQFLGPYVFPEVVAHY